MTNDFFRDQVRRLRVRFGEKAFDPEFIQLVWREVHDMSEQGFARFVDVMIGSRTAQKPPLLSEFREARLNEQKNRFENDLRGATQVIRRGPEEMRKQMRLVLSREFGAVDGIADAVEIAKIRQKTRGDNDGGGGGAA